MRHGGVAAAVSVNVFGDVWAREAPPPLREPTRQSEVVLSLDQAKVTFLADEDGDGRCHALLSLKGGELYVLSVGGTGAGGDAGMALTRVGSTVVTSALLPLPGGRYVVLASRLADTLLVEYSRVVAPAAPSAAATAADQTAAAAVAADTPADRIGWRRW